MVKIYFYATVFFEIPPAMAGRSSSSPAPSPPPSPLQARRRIQAKRKRMMMKKAFYWYMRSVAQEASKRFKTITGPIFMCTEDISDM